MLWTRKRHLKVTLRLESRQLERLAHDFEGMLTKRAKQHQSAKDFCEAKYLPEAICMSALLD